MNWLAVCSTGSGRIELFQSCSRDLESTNTCRTSYYSLLSVNAQSSKPIELSLHVLTRADGPASLSRGRLTHPAAHEALDGLGMLLWRNPPPQLVHPRRARILARRCNPPTFIPPPGGPRRLCSALIPDRRCLPPRPTSRPECPGIQFWPGSPLPPPDTCPAASKRVSRKPRKRP